MTKEEQYAILDAQKQDILKLMNDNVLNSQSNVLGAPVLDFSDYDTPGQKT